jgi:vacuolar-type H+-ATPase subunit F/Vma7
MKGRVAVLGERSEVAGYALAGAVVLEAEDSAAVDAQWAGLPDDIVVVVVGAAAARHLGERRTREGSPLTVVMPP